MTEQPPKAARLLEQAILFNFVIHAVAMGSMALLLLPGMPGGATANVAMRAAYVGAHPWLWRIGWLPWQFTAWADLLFSIALLRTVWIPRWPARITVILTVLAIIPDQGGQLLWITRGVRLAQEAMHTANPAPYAQFESATFQLVGAWGCLGYLAGAIGWTWCLAAAGTWNRTLTKLSFVTWGAFAISTILLFLPAQYRPPALVAAGGNAVGFILLQTWLVLVGEAVLCRSRPDQPTGAWKPWQFPVKGILGACVDAIANSRFARLATEWLPPPALVSDIRDVIFSSYVVEVEHLLPLVPWGLEIQRLGPDGRHAMFSVLTFNHGHFGPKFFGALRYGAPSPVQSNWRIYVIDPKTGYRGVYFLTTAITSTAYALTARLLSEGVPMHVPKSGHVLRQADGRYDVSLDPGDGTAPDLRAKLGATSNVASMPAAFAACFANFAEYLDYCLPQDRALAPQPWYRRIARQEIRLGIPPDACSRADGKIESDAVKAIVGDAEPMTFIVSSVKFRFDVEAFDHE